MSSADAQPATTSPKLNGPTADVAAGKRRVKTDSLATSLIFLFGLSAVQPLVSFGRGVLFCRALSPADLGAWDMALSFLMLAGTVVVFGIPGSFGRYVEHYTQRGQLAMFLRRTTWTCTALTALAMVLLATMAPLFSEIIFGRADRTMWVYCVAAGLGALIAHGFVVELLTAMRLFRVVSGLQLLKAVSFVILSLVLLISWEGGPASVILGHTAASVLAIAVSLYWLLPAWRAASDPTTSSTDIDATIIEEPAPTATQFWVKLMPFALWVWIANFLSHLFELIDRYMIVHYSGMPNDVALTQVGHYHSSRIVPLLFISFAGMLSGILLPHMTKDWERGRRDQVSDGLNLAVKILGLALTAGSVTVLAIAPQLFQYGFGGRYDGGLAVLPWTLAYCVWFGIFLIGDLYICCAERVRLVSLALFIGLLANVFFNLALLPDFGLQGAVWATAISKFVVLITTFLFARGLGMKFHRGVWFITLLPLAICLGAFPAAAILFVTLAAIVGTDAILTNEEKTRLIDLAQPVLARLSGR